MTPAERVERLVRDGTIAAAEGERLLAAMHAEPARSPLYVLLHPFDRFGGETAALVGLVVSALSVAVTRLGVRFDGFLDLHIPHQPPPLHTSIAEQLIAWILPALCFWAYARVFARHVRVLDFIGMVGLARLPLLVAAIPVLYAAPLLIANPTHPSPTALLLLTVPLVFVAINITLLYQGFKNASGLTGPRLVGGFIGLLIGAEVISKLALVFLP
jgi:hypothetical protein